MNDGFWSRRLSPKLITICLVLLWSAKADIIPSFITGKHVHQISWVVQIQIGTIRKPIKAIIDRRGGKLTTIFPINKIVSKSFSSYAGGSDIVLIGEQRILFEHEVNPSLPAALGCPSCQAVLGVGAASPIWFHFEKVLYTPGSILLDESTDSFEYLTNGEGFVPCELAAPEICVTSGIVFGETVRVAFGHNQESLLLPPALFDKYVDGKSLKNNPPEDWASLKIKFPAIPGTGKDNELVIQREHLVVPSDGQGNHLLVDVSPVPDTVFIGRGARLNVMIQVIETEGKAKITSIKVSKHYSMAGLLAGILIALIFEYWRQTPTGTWEDFNFASPYKICSIGLTIVAGIVIYASEEYQCALQPFPVVNVYVGIMVFGMIVWLLGVIVMYFTSTSRNVLGWVVRKRMLLGTMKKPTKPINEELEGEDDVKVEKYLSEGSGVYVPGDVRSRKKHTSATGRIVPGNENKTRDKNAEDVNSSMIDDLLYSGAVSDQSSPEALYERVYFNTRLWIIASVAMESALLALTFLILIETRTEALWGLAGTLVILYLLYRLGYNLFIILNLGDGNRSFVWTGFIFYLCLVIVATIVVAQRYVVGPTVERLFSTEEFLTIVGSATLYLIIGYWSVWAAISTILLQDKKMARFLAEKRNTNE